MYLLLQSPAPTVNKSHNDSREADRRRRQRDEPWNDSDRHSSSHSPYGLQKDREPSPLAKDDKKDDREEKEEIKEPQYKANFKASGALAAAARTTESGVVLKYATPAEARTPTLKWRLFPFKGDEALEPIVIHEKSTYLFGRDRDVCDIPLDNLSCSTQHAVIVHRQVSKTDPATGLRAYVVKPFIIDLESRNGTFLNDVKLDDSRYYELMDKDCIRFGASTREYIVLNERSR